MSEPTQVQPKNTSPRAGAVPFYGAIRSENEVYFQMASLFREVTKGETGLSDIWMKHILKSRGVKISGKFFADSL